MGRPRLGHLEGNPLSNNGPRYQARVQCHLGCCGTVLDTTRLDPWNRHIVVAECDDIEDAKKIALALNRTADT